jgi:hypothetical protein
MPIDTSLVVAPISSVLDPDFGDDSSPFDDSDNDGDLSVFQANAVRCAGKQLGNAIADVATGEIRDYLNIPELSPMLEAIDNLNETRRDLATLAKSVAATTPIVCAARSLFPAGATRNAFDVGIGMMQHQIVPPQFSALRPQAKSARYAFDAACALQIGRCVHPEPPAGRGYAAKAGYYITRGVMRSLPEHKAAIVATLSSSPDHRVGAQDAIKQIAAARGSWGYAIKDWLGLL